MGYLNNSSRILDAILTKKGREILSSGGDFSVTKFALGDDEIDYALWDTAHTQGTDYYGAVIDNLPALEPFNDPSEIMKYKLVTRGQNSPNFQPRAMIEFIDGGGTSNALGQLVYYKNPGNNDTKRTLVQGPAGQGVGVSTLLGGGPSAGDLATSAEIKVGRVPNSELVGEYDFDLLSTETYTVTILDSSVAVLAPISDVNPEDNLQMIIVPESNTYGPPFVPTDADKLWIPFVDNVQHISQTVSGCTLGGSNKLNFPQDGTTGYRNILIYPKNITETATKTSILVTGDLSGAVIEFDLTITLDIT